MIKRIVYWKRDISSVESVSSLDFVFAKTNTLNNKEISKEERDKVCSTLLNDFDILNYDKDYLAYKFEDDKNNFNIKFFLTIYFYDNNYLAIKGIHPFKQKNYKEIINFFNQYI